MAQEDTETLVQRLAKAKEENKTLKTLNLLLIEKLRLLESC